MDGDSLRLFYSGKWLKPFSNMLKYRSPRFKSWAMIDTRNRLTVLTVYKISGNKADYVNARSGLSYQTDNQAHSIRFF